MQQRTFSSTSTFSTFGETGGLAATQTIGRAGVVDLTGGYRFGTHLGVAIGIWGASTKSAAAAAASVPDPLFVGRFKTVTMTSEDAGTTLKQTDLGANLLLTWTTPVTERIETVALVAPLLAPKAAVLLVADDPADPAHDPRVADGLCLLAEAACRPRL